MNINICKHWHTSRLALLFSENTQKNNLFSETHALQFKYGSLVAKKQYTLTDDLIDTYKKYTIIQPGDIIVNGLNLNYDFVTQRVALSEHKGIITSAYICLRPRKDVSAKFYTYYLKALDSIKAFNGMGTGIRLTLSYDLIKNMSLPVPPRDEQDQIVRYLDWQVSKINRLIAAKRKEIELLNEQFSAVINNAVSGYDSSVPKHDSGISLLGQIPQGWHVRPFSKIATVKSNLVDPALYKDMQQISPASIEKNTARILELCTVEQAGVSSPNHRFYKGQIIYSKIRPRLNKVIIAPFDGLCSADMYPIETVLNTEYLLFYLLSSSYLQQLSVTANRVKMPKINQEELGATLVLIPPEQEQREIVATIKSKCSKIQLLIEKIKLQIDAASDLRTRLISDVVTGQIDVRGIEVPDYEHYDEAPENATEESSDSDYDTEE